MDVLGGDDAFDHRFLLVDLDRVQRGVAALVFQALDVGVEGRSACARGLAGCPGSAPAAADRPLAQLLDLLNRSIATSGRSDGLRRDRRH
jgi:hypothetical protein